VSRTVALLSFRLGGIDGVSVVAASWARVLGAAGHQVVTVAGAGPVDRRLPGLAWPPSGSAVPSRAALEQALGDADLVVVENLCSLPLHPEATAAVADVLAGRPALLHHYDLPWQRARFATLAGWPPDDPAWAHVTINDHSRGELAERGIAATTIRCGIDVRTRAGDRDATRARLGVGPGERLVLHPVRAIERKAVPVAVALAEDLGATYWLTGPAEEGYGPTLSTVLASARCPTLHRPAPDIADAYAACDAVALPSTWEGFGNPLAEAAVHRRPIAVGRYPAAAELEALGFRWFPGDDHRPLAAFLDDPDPALHDTNAALVREHLSLERVADDLRRLLAERWSW
jgi:glycosyltransferase involved in cell wall biosynthesis